ncbi:hypothetical protein TNCV_1731361 [Trichonephila clavipes]|nr:hypothetical protein TNCV_1731361 [Trichonephila clavipes]
MTNRVEELMHAKSVEAQIHHVELVWNVLMNEYKACLRTKHWGFSSQTNHLTGTSAHAPQRPESRRRAL